MRSPSHFSGGLRDAYQRTQDPQSTATNPIGTVVPPVLYLPVRELPEGGIAAEVHQITDGRRAVLVFTALDRLLSVCGGEQPWKLIETVALDAIQETQPFDIVAFDPELPQNLLAGGRIA